MIGSLQRFPSLMHPNSGERVRDVYFTEDTLAVDLADGRTIIVPLTCFGAREK